MRKALLGVAGASLLLAGAVTASAQVNCKVVLKNLESGRTDQEVAETMVISVSDVKKCKEEKAAAAAAAPATGDKPAAAPAGAGGAMGGEKH
jgi:hypothetical protein